VTIRHYKIFRIKKSEQSGDVMQKAIGFLNRLDIKGAIIYNDHGDVWIKHCSRDVATALQRFLEEQTFGTYSKGAMV
jgi:hypothetical protein